MVTDGLEPERVAAITILETTAEMLGNEEVFDCKDGNGRWYEFEDAIVDILKDSTR